MIVFVFLILWTTLHAYTTEKAKVEFEELANVNPVSYPGWENALDGIPKSNLKIGTSFDVSMTTPVGKGVLLNGIGYKIYEHSSDSIPAVFGKVTSIGVHNHPHFTITYESKHMDRVFTASDVDQVKNEFEDAPRAVAGSGYCFKYLYSFKHKNGDYELCGKRVSRNSNVGYKVKAVFFESDPRNGMKWTFEFESKLEHGYVEMDGQVVLNFLGGADMLKRVVEIELSPGKHTLVYYGMAKTQMMEPKMNIVRDRVAGPFDLATFKSFALYRRFQLNVEGNGKRVSANPGHTDATSSRFHYFHSLMAFPALEATYKLHVSSNTETRLVLAYVPAERVYYMQADTLQLLQSTSMATISDLSVSVSTSGAGVVLYSVQARLDWKHQLPTTGSIQFQAFVNTSSDVQPSYTIQTSTVGNTPIPISFATAFNVDSATTATTAALQYQHDISSIGNVNEDPEMYITGPQATALFLPGAILTTKTVPDTLSNAADIFATTIAITVPGTFIIQFMGNVCKISATSSFYFTIQVDNHVWLDSKFYVGHEGGNGCSTVYFKAMNSTNVGTKDIKLKVNGGTSAFELKGFEMQAIQIPKAVLMKNEAGCIEHCEERQSCGGVLYNSENKLCHANAVETTASNTANSVKSFVRSKTSNDDNWGRLNKALQTGTTNSNLLGQCNGNCTTHICHRDLVVDLCKCLCRNMASCIGFNFQNATTAFTVCTEIKRVELQQSHAFAMTASTIAGNVATSSTPGVAYLNIPTSCNDIIHKNSQAQSGWYEILTSKGLAKAYCHMENGRAYTSINADQNREDVHSKAAEGPRDSNSCQAGFNLDMVVPRSRSHLRGLVDVFGTMYNSQVAIYKKTLQSSASHESPSMPLSSAYDTSYTAVDHGTWWLSDVAPALEMTSVSSATPKFLPLAGQSPFDLDTIEIAAMEPISKSLYICTPNDVDHGTIWERVYERSFAENSVADKWTVSWSTPKLDAICTNMNLLSGSATDSTSHATLSLTNLPNEGSYRMRIRLTFFVFAELFPSDIEAVVLVDDQIVWQGSHSTTYDTIDLSCASGSVVPIYITQIVDNLSGSNQLITVRNANLPAGDVRFGIDDVRIEVEHIFESTKGLLESDPFDSCFHVKQLRLQNGENNPMGLYWLKGLENVPVFQGLCEDGKLVIQTQQVGFGSDGYFQQEDYVNGIVDAYNYKYWIGSDILSHITKYGLSLTVKLVDILGIEYAATYEYFQVLSEDDGFKLLIGEYRNDATPALEDALSSLNGTIFCDGYSCIDTSECTIPQGFWYANCPVTAKLNAKNEGGYGLLLLNDRPEVIIWKEQGPFRHSKMSVQTHNLPPKILMDDVSLTALPNQEAGQVIATSINVWDPDQKHSFTFSEASGTSNEYFEISSSGTISTKRSLTYELGLTYIFDIQVSDDTGLYDTSNLKITLVCKEGYICTPDNADIAHNFDGICLLGKQQLNFSENTNSMSSESYKLVPETDKVRHELYHRDGESLPLNYYLNLAGHISSKMGYLPNFEVESTTNLTLAYYWGNSNEPYTICNISIVIQDVDEPPFCKNIGQIWETAENLPIGTSLGTLDCLDPDTNSDLVLSIDQSSTSVPFEIGIGNILQTTEILNYTHAWKYEVSLMLTSNGESKIEPLQVQVKCPIGYICDGPELLARATFKEKVCANGMHDVQLIENAPFLSSESFSLLQSDQHDLSATLQSVDGSNALFQLNSNGTIKSVENFLPNYEETSKHLYQLTYQLANSWRPLATCNISFSIIDANDAPILQNLSEIRQVSEESLPNSFVSLPVTVQDQDPNDTHVFYIAGGNKTLFDISSKGYIRVLAKLDYAAMKTHYLTVGVKDSCGQKTTGDIQINVLCPNGYNCIEGALTPKATFKNNICAQGQESIEVSAIKPYTSFQDFGLTHFVPELWTSVTGIGSTAMPDINLINVHNSSYIYIYSGISYGELQNLNFKLDYYVGSTPRLYATCNVSISVLPSVGNEFAVY